jgi:hypothetical protein
VVGPSGNGGEAAAGSGEPCTPFTTTVYLVFAVTVVNGGDRIDPKELTWPLLIGEPERVAEVDSIQSAPNSLEQVVRLFLFTVAGGTLAWRHRGNHPVWGTRGALASEQIAQRSAARNAAAQRTSA